jgi:adenosylmethionine-8-amino-7-oxononanoate aminotransferase
VTDARYHFIPHQGGEPTIVGGEGCWLHTADGRRILDAAGGAIVGNVGWGRKEVADATYAVMVHGAYSVPIWPTEQRLLLRDRLVERWLPEGFTQVFFTSGGSESTDSAIRLARNYQLGKGRPDRWKVVGRHPSYHGMTLGTIAVASHSTRQVGFEPLLLPFPKVPWNDPDAVVEVIEREGPETIAGFIAEPITGAAGACLTASDDYWRAVTDICHRYDILLITDEVMCGYGRTGLNFGFQHFPFEPDVIVGGKGLGGGYVPMGAVAARTEVADVLSEAGLMYFTFGGNDTACAASLAVLDIMEREGLVERAAKMGAILGDRLHAELDGHPAVVDVRGRGMFYGIELSIPNAPVIAEALSRDVWVYPAGSGPVPSAVMIAPPFVITDDELEQVVTTLRVSLDAVTAT